MRLKLEKWCVVSRSSYSLQAPEDDQSCLHGFVSGHPRCIDGREVTTSPVIFRKGNKIVTRSGSEYELGEVDSLYESAFPDARNRFLKGLRAIFLGEISAYEI